MSALGHGMDMMTSSPQIDEKRLFTSETKKSAQTRGPDRFIPDYRVNNTTDGWGNQLYNQKRQSQALPANREYPIQYQPYPEGPETLGQRLEEESQADPRFGQPAETQDDSGS